MQDFATAFAFINLFTHNQADITPIDFRLLHDQNKAVAGIPLRGTLRECWDAICHYNNQGYGAFAVISALDGYGRSLENVAYARAHFADLDNSAAIQNYHTALAFALPPTYCVQSSANKYHL